MHHRTTTVAVAASAAIAAIALPPPPPPPRGVGEFTNRIKRTDGGASLPALPRAAPAQVDQSITGPLPLALGTGASQVGVSYMDLEASDEVPQASAAGVGESAAIVSTTRMTAWRLNKRKQLEATGGQEAVDEARRIESEKRKQRRLAAKIAAAATTEEDPGGSGGS